MVLVQVQMLCDFFDVIRVEVEGGNRGKPLNKDDTIENLLDFLAQPHADFLNVTWASQLNGGDKKKVTSKEKKKKATPAKKATVSKKSGKKPAAHPFRLVLAHKKGKEPNEATIRNWIQAYIVCFDMDLATSKHAIQTASDKFGYDLSKKKEKIKEMLSEEMELIQDY